MLFLCNCDVRKTVMCVKVYLRISSNAATLCLQLSTWKVEYMFSRITETLLLTVCFSRMKMRLVLRNNTEHHEYYKMLMLSVK